MLQKSGRLRLTGKKTLLSRQSGEEEAVVAEMVPKMSKKNRKILFPK